VTAVENWTFGFERVVDLRLKPVNAATRDLQRAEAELTRLKDQREHMAASRGQNRNELRTGVVQRDAGIAELTAQLGKEAEVHQRNLEGIREACRIIRDRCMVPRSQAEDGRYAAAVSQLATELKRQRDERKQLQSQIDELVSVDTADSAEKDQLIAAAAGVASDARKALRAVADGNQIYRLAANWYGVSTSDVTPEQFAMARWVFSTFSAVAVAFAGSVAALVYYARNRVPGSVSFLGRLATKVARARRAYYVRKRRPLKIEVAGPERVIYREGKEPPVVIEKEPVVIEKEVVRWIEQIVLIPCRGIRMPFHINSIIRKGDRSSRDSQHEGAVNEVASNVMTLKKAN
jgi:flagellar biosynthesis chaperone FliJ